MSDHDEAEALFSDLFGYDCPDGIDPEVYIYSDGPEEEEWVILLLVTLIGSFYVLAGRGEDDEEEEHWRS